MKQLFVVIVCLIGFQNVMPMQDQWDYEWEDEVMEKHLQKAIKKNTTLDFKQFPKFSEGVLSYFVKTRTWSSYTAKPIKNLSDKKFSEIFTTFKLLVGNPPYNEEVMHRILYIETHSIFQFEKVYRLFVEAVKAGSSIERHDQIEINFLSNHDIHGDKLTSDGVGQVMVAKFTAGKNSFKTDPNNLSLYRYIAALAKLFYAKTAKDIEDAMAAKHRDQVKTFINVRKRDMQTPLMWHAQQGNTEIVKALLTHNPDLGAKDKDGKTVYEYQLTPEITNLLPSGGQDQGVALNSVVSALQQVKKTLNALTKKLEALGV